MAERPNVKDILAAARLKGAVKPAGEPTQAEVEPEVSAAVTESAAPVAAAPKASAAPTGRPLSLKEKLAAARSGGAATPGAAPPAKAAPVEVEVPAVEAAAPAVEAAPKPAAIPTGRPLTLKEKLAAARGGAAPAAAGPAGVAKPAAPKAAPVAAKAAATRELPPLDKITDPRDLAEALRRAGADKDKAVKSEAAAKAAGAAPGPTSAAAAKAAVAKKLESKAIPPKPSKGAVAATTGASPGTPASAPIARRPFLWGVTGIIVAGWGAFAFGIGTQLAACARFMFPNVLAEPPLTVKVGMASRFEKEQVNDTWKAEWGFWIVRSTAYDGEDKIYAIQSVCTHLGCPPNWLAAEAKFKCPCHGSGFYISGVNFEGPAPRPLERFKVAVNDAGEIVVDKSQKFQEELKQWSDADSFIVA